MLPLQKKSWKTATCTTQAKRPSTVWFWKPLRKEPQGVDKNARTASSWPTLVVPARSCAGEKSRQRFKPELKLSDAQEKAVISSHSLIWHCFFPCNYNTEVRLPQSKWKIDCGRGSLHIYKHCWKRLDRDGWLCVGLMCCELSTTTSLAEPPSQGIWGKLLKPKQVSKVGICAAVHWRQASEHQFKQDSQQLRAP